MCTRLVSLRHIQGFVFIICKTTPLGFCASENVFSYPHFIQVSLLTERLITLRPIQTNHLSLCSVFRCSVCQELYLLTPTKLHEAVNKYDSNGQ